MCINLWLPISIFEVEYELGSGRPVTELDMLIMEAIQNQRELTIDQLADLFYLPSRIIVEVAVTLARSNWITVNPENGGFVVTEYGNSELRSGNRPRYLNVKTAVETIIMECFLGQVCLSNRVSIKKPNKDEHKIEENVDSRLLTIEDVKSVLRVETDEWIRFIDTPRLVSRGHRAIKLEIDLTEQKVSFLPDAWKNRLEPVLVEKAKNLYSTP